MRKIILLIVAVVCFQSAFTQAKKPTLMVVPSMNWCFQNGYMLSYNNQGSIVQIPDYQRALIENPEIIPVITKIGEIFANREFPIKDLAAEMNSVQSQSSEMSMLTSKSGSNVSESPYDLLKKKAKADIIIALSWTVNQIGPKKSITFTLQGLDAYTSKQVAGATGTGAQSFSTELPILLEEAVLTHMDNFVAGIQRHFDDLFANGREISVSISKFDSWDNDLESEYNGIELSDIIDDWMAKNTVKGRYSLTDATENFMEFKQVRIPLYDTNGTALDARKAMRPLSDFLKNAPYSIVNKLTTKGLGEVTIVLGEK